MSNAALYDATGGPEVLYVAEVADPEARPGKVAVRVHAAGLNPFDGKVRSGFIPSSAPFPRRIGGDFAGTVEAVGPDVTSLKPGDRVAYFSAAYGGYASERLIRADLLVRLPDAIDDRTAAAIEPSGASPSNWLAGWPSSRSE